MRSKSGSGKNTNEPLSQSLTSPPNTGATGTSQLPFGTWLRLMRTVNTPFRFAPNSSSSDGRQDIAPDEPTPTQSKGQRIVRKELPPRHSETIHEKHHTCSGQTVCERMRSFVKAEVQRDLQELACVISEALLRELTSLLVQKTAEPDTFTAALDNRHGAVTDVAEQQRALALCDHHRRYGP
jgi:hypothetical protein